VGTSSSGVQRQTRGSRELRRCRRLRPGTGSAEGRASPLPPHARRSGSRSGGWERRAGTKFGGGGRFFTHVATRGLSMPGSPPSSNGARPVATVRSLGPQLNGGREGRLDVANKLDGQVAGAGDDSVHLDKQAPRTSARRRVHVQPVNLCDALDVDTEDARKGQAVHSIELSKAQPHRVSGGFQGGKLNVRRGDKKLRRPGRRVVSRCGGVSAQGMWRVGGNKPGTKSGRRSGASGGR
jgi:hypothetical protein